MYFTIQTISQSLGENGRPAAHALPIWLLVRRGNRTRACVCLMQLGLGCS
jgi:hypothetical protein